MRSLSMMSLPKFKIIWPALLALGISGFIPAALSAQMADNNQAAGLSFEQLKIAAASAAQNGENAKAILDIQHALELQPDWKEGWWNLGTLQYETSQYADAVQAFQKVIAYAPRLGTAWALLGLCEFELKQYGPSLSYLEKAQALGF